MNLVTLNLCLPAHPAPTTTSFSLRIVDDPEAATDELRGIIDCGAL